jgi:hypothetical protein
METIIPVVMVASFLGVFALILFVARRQRRRGRDNLGNLAQQLGLPPPVIPQGFWAAFKSAELRGDHRGRAVRIYNYTTGSGKSRTTWCALSLPVQNPSKMTLRVSRENMLTRVGRVFGVDDVATGDTAFDDQFYVKSNDAGYVRAAFIPEVRTRISTVWKDGARGTISVDGSEIKYAEVGSFSSDKICGRFPALVDVAHLLADVVEARGG